MLNDMHALLRPCRTLLSQSQGRQCSSQRIATAAAANLCLVEWHHCVAKDSIYADRSVALGVSHVCGVVNAGWLLLRLTATDSVL